MWSALRRRALPFMAACAFASAISGTLSGTAEAAPIRVASLNLCTDELVLLMAAPMQIVSVTHLARSRHESALWQTARRFRSNDGSIVSVAGLQPDVIVTMGGLARDRERLARRIGARVVVLDYPMSLDDIAEDAMEIAEAIGRNRHGRRIVRALRRMEASAPEAGRQGIFLGSGGATYPQASLGARWLRLAGMETPAALGAQLSAEAILLDPPSLVIRSDYRAEQASRSSHWLGYRFLARAGGTQTLRTDGRLWTCAGPLLIAEVARLRREIAR